MPKVLISFEVLVYYRQNSTTQLGKSIPIINKYLAHFGAQCRELKPLRKDDSYQEELLMAKFKFV